eukprot:353210_1
MAVRLPMFSKLERDSPSSSINYCGEHPDIKRDEFLHARFHQLKASKAMLEYRPVSRVSSDIETKTSNPKTNPISYGPYHKLFYKLIHDLMNAKERKLFYLSILFTICCGILRLMFFIFVSTIIDLLNGTFSNTNLHKLCPISESINCNSSEILIHVFIIFSAIICIIATIIDYTQTIICSNICCSFIPRLNSKTFKSIISQNLLFFDMKEKRDLRYILSKDIKNIRFCIYKLIIISESLAHFLFGLIYIFIV